MASIGSPREVDPNRKVNEVSVKISAAENGFIVTRMDTMQKYLSASLGMDHAEDDTVASIVKGFFDEKVSL
jgi:hypothetical protein